MGVVKVFQLDRKSEVKLCVCDSLSEDCGKNPVSSNWGFCAEEFPDDPSPENQTKQKIKRRCRRRSNQKLLSDAHNNNNDNNSSTCLGLYISTGPNLSFLFWV